MRAAMLLLVTALAIPNVSSTPGDGGVLVVDPVGDVRAGPVPVHAGASSFDLVEVRILEESRDEFVLQLRVADVTIEPPYGEVAAHMQINGSWWIVGWTTIAFPGPPFAYKGGFYCPSDAGGSADPSRCDGLDGAPRGDAYQVTVDRALLRAEQVGTRVEQVRAYADAYNAEGSGVRLDETNVGGSYSFRTGRLPFPPAPAEPAASSSSEPAATSHVAADVKAKADASGPTWSIGTLLVAIVALRRRVR